MALTPFGKGYGTLAYFTLGYPVTIPGDPQHSPFGHGGYQVQTPAGRLSNRQCLVMLLSVASRWRYGAKNIGGWLC